MISGLLFVGWAFHSLVAVSLSGSYIHVCWSVVLGRVFVQIGEWQRGTETCWVKRQRGVMPKSYKNPVRTKSLDLWGVEVWWAERAPAIRL